MGILKDITERKRAEEALRASEEKFRLLFNDSPLGIALVDPEGIIKEVNNSLLQLLSNKKRRIYREGLCSTDLGFWFKYPRANFRFQK